MNLKEFMTQDHNRLERILRDFLSVGDEELAQARKLFHEFKIGVERHLAWEEEVLFPSIECRTGMQAPGPSTLVRSQHRQIREFLEKIFARILNGESAKEAQRELIDLLALHSREEERVLYPWVDLCLCLEEKEEAIERMKRLPAGKAHR